MSKELYTSLSCGAFMGCLISPSLFGIVIGALVMVGLNKVIQMKQGLNNGST